MPDAGIGHGADFLRGDGGGPETFATVGDITNITTPSISRDAVDTTHLGSVEGWREVTGGLKDGGEVTIEFNSDPSDATTAALFGDLSNNAPKNYQIKFPDATAWIFSALLTAVDSGVPLADKMAGSATFKLSGKPAFIV